ncbi:Di-sulfide bridge nucleocytoplasmic transport domain-containing protein [Circinella umbellata]|nr:Di-sulfide bridge nucleocytoplasmic transport domain-containing protein [Circinella umbellata]
MQEEQSGKRRKTSHPHPSPQPLPSEQITNTSRSSFLFSRHAPLVFSNYLKLLLHACGLFIFILAIHFILSASHREIDGRVMQHLQELEEEKIQCFKKYQENQCDLYGHQPFFSHFCNQWQQCMNRDLGAGIARTKMIMMAYGEMVNALVEPLTIKAMLTICLLLFGVFIGSTLVF